MRKKVPGTAKCGKLRPIVVLPPPVTPRGIREMLLAHARGEE